MTVAELAAELQNCKPGTPVYFEHNGISYPISELAVYCGAVELLCPEDEDLDDPDA